MTHLEALFRRRFEESAETKRSTAQTLLAPMAAAADLLIAAYRTGNKAIFLGNGGSAADAQHMAAELVGRFLHERRPLPALALTTNSSSVTAIANDYGYEQVFVRQVEALGVAGDVLVGLSTSGNSANIVEAFVCARSRGIKTIAMTGRTGGRLAAISDILLNVPSDDIPRIQECHTLIGHTLCEAVESALMD